MARQTQERTNHAPFRGASPWLYAVRNEFMHLGTAEVAKLPLKDVTLELRQGRQTLWLVARWPSGGGVAIRTTYSPEDGFIIENSNKIDGLMQCVTSTGMGRFRICVEILDEEKSLVRFTTWLTPAGELNIPFWPSDTYPIDENGDPLATRGVVHAAQRGPAAGFMFMSLTEPASGSLFYLQNLTSLNDYCEQTHTVPETRVGGSWPELGYTPPIAERKPLAAGKEIIISDAFVRFSSELPENTGKVAHLYFDMLSDIYQYYPRPGAVYQHWLSRAEKTVNDLRSPDCITRKDDHYYLNAYVGTGNRRPESLVQLAVMLPLLEYENWSGKKIPLINELRENLSSFYDEQIECMLRYPKSMEHEEVEDVDEKEPWEIDSWYLYHPLANLARLAKFGYEDAKRLLLDSLEYAIEVARHFKYKWPVTFEADTLEALKEAPEYEMGETDVPGLYAYLMLEVWDITGKRRYLREAKNAAKALKGLGFNIGYQFNNTAWAANALARLWKETGEDYYIELSYICLASIMQNAFLWDCNYGYAKHYSTFFGVTPLREGAYIALYEELEIFSAFHEYFELMDGHMLRSVRILLAEYCKYSVDGKYCFYPSSLPEEAISTKVQNGYINRDLAIPLEDIYQGWEQAGRVGQEVYGAGVALGFVMRSYHHVESAPFLLFCQYPVYDLHVDPDESQCTLRVRGDSNYGCMLRLIPTGDEPLSEATVRLRATGAQKQRTGIPTDEGHLEYFIVGDSTVIIDWVTEVELEQINSFQEVTTG